MFTFVVCSQCQRVKCKVEESKTLNLFSVWKFINSRSSFVRGVKKRRMSRCTLNPLLRCLFEISYGCFFSYFLPGEVGWRWALLNTSIALLVLGVGMSYVSLPWKSRNLNRELLRTRKQERESHFQKIREELSKADETQIQKRRRIAALTFHQLKDELQSGNISALDAVDAFRWKAWECQEKFNCVVEFVKEATSIALALDSEYSSGKQKPPLFGMPFSVKESFYMPGYDSTAGLAKFLGQPLQEENTLVAHLRSLGAVPIVRTNIPQTCVSFTCSNCIYGTTLNPFDKTRTPGGSSGGEGCIIASGGCPFGIGNDVGGSLRIPAHFCGITTLKPTSGRPRVFGANVGTPGVVKVALSYGFFTKDASSLAYLFELTLAPEYFNRVPECVPTPFNRDLFQSGKAKLRIGLYLEDGWFPSVPACRRAVTVASRILTASGHELIPFSVPSPEKAVPIMTTLLFPDNCACYKDLFNNEDVDPYLKRSKFVASLPLSVRWLLSKALKPIDKRSSIAMSAYARNLSDLRAISVEADEYKKQFLKYWRSLDLDAVVGTVLPFPALKHDGPGNLSHGVFGTLLYNLLDFPAGVVPVTNVTKTDESEMSSYPNADAATSRFQNPFDKMLREDMINSEGLPVGVQVITLPYQEEACLRVMRAIEDGVRNGNAE